MWKLPCLQEVALLLAVFFVHSSSLAASFDCRVPSAARERLICGDQGLSRADEDLGRAYQGDLDMLSPRGQRLLQESQRSWLRFIGTVCPISRPASPPNVPGPVQCVQREYEARLAQLSTIGKKRGPYTFIRVDVFAASPDNEDNTGRRTGFRYAHLAYPQIDSPDTPATRAWNEHVAKKMPIPGGCEGPADDDLDFQLGIASPRLISLAWQESHYCHGTPHGFFGYRSDNQVLLPSPRDLLPSDLFKPDPSLTSQLELAFWHALQAQGWTPPNDDAKELILDAAATPQSWLLTGTGLSVDFSAYAGGCYVCNPRPVTVSWDELKPLLASSAIAP